MRGLTAGGIALLAAMLWWWCSEGPWRQVPEPLRGTAPGVLEPRVVTADAGAPGIRNPVPTVGERRPIAIRGRVVGLDHGLAAGLMVHVAGFEGEGVACGPDGAFELCIALPTGSHSVVASGAFAIVEPRSIEVAADSTELAGISLSASLAVPVKVTLAIEPALVPIIRALGDVEWWVCCRGPEAIESESDRVVDLRMQGGADRFAVDGRVEHVAPLTVTVVARTATTHGSFPVARQTATFQLADGAFPPCHFRVTREDFVSGRVVGSSGEPLLDAEIVVDGRRTALLTFGSGQFLVPTRSVGALSARFGPNAGASTHELAAGDRHGVILRVDTAAMVKVRLRDRAGPRSRFRVLFNNNSDCQGLTDENLPTLVDGVFVLKQTVLPAGTRLYLRDAEHGEWREELANEVTAGQVIDLVVPPLRRSTVRIAVEGRVPELATVDLTEVDAAAPQRLRRPWFYSARLPVGGDELVLSGLAPSDYFVEVVRGGVKIAKDRIRLLDGDHRITLRLPE